MDTPAQQAILFANLVRQILRLITFLLVPVSGAIAAQPSTYPSKPITWVVGYAAGGGLDTLTRIVADDLAQRLRQPVVVENRVGASGAIGAASVARALPDGYTLITFDSGSYAVNPALFSNLQYDSRRDFTIVATIARIPFVLVVNPNLKVTTLAESRPQKQLQTRSITPLLG